MSKGKIAGLGCLAIIIITVCIIGFSALGNYNGLTKERENVKAQWGEVQNQYQRRYDLVPNLVNTVQGYAAHESQVLEAVTASRSQVGSIQVTKDIVNNPAELQKFQQAQAGLTGALSRLMVVMERYPDLKANEGFRDLQSQLEGTENRISTARKRFNDAANPYNTKVQQFPAVIFARLFGFQEIPYFQAAPGSEKAPVVNFKK
jgi:LemA protein